MSASSRFVLGTLVGAAVGVALGMLFAPRSGEETRRLIRDELSNRVDEQVSSVKSALHDQSTAWREKAEVLKRRAGEIASDLEATGRRALGKGEIHPELSDRPSGSPVI